jgi:dienelactone hydrolase
MSTERPFGTWSSPITPALMARGGTRLAFPDVLADGTLSWIESRPADGGRSVPVQRAPGAQPHDALDAPHSVRTRVHEYGGRAHLALPDALYFVAAKGGGLFRRAADGQASAIGEPSGFRLAELVSDPDRDRLLCVGEQEREGGEPENGIVAVSLADGRVEWLARGHDFYAAPARSPSGAQLAFLAWDHPTMAWDAAALYLAELSRDGSVISTRHVAGGPTGAAFQPTWSPRGELYFALEDGERWTLHRLADGRAERVCDAGVELGAPLWNLGTRLFAFSDARTVIATGLWQGRSRVVRIDTETGGCETITDELPHVGELACGASTALALCGWAGGGSRLVAIEPRSGALSVVRDVLEGVLDAAFVSKPEAISYPTSRGDIAYANLYRPRSPDFHAPAGSRPPVVVLAHGGPTGCANTETQLSIQFWTTRGFAVLDVNYRGSTGFGRTYREKLRGEWGVLDVDDCVAGVRHLAGLGEIDPARAIIRGGSAGGYTVLQALTDHDVFRAAACHYGPSDPRTFVSETHKFEKHYEKYLFGEGEACARALEERAPIRKVEHIRAPVIFFQGLEDPAVVPSQTSRVHEALKQRGVETEYHGYAGEQHGFRKAATIEDVWEKELAFYKRVLAL